VTIIVISLVLSAFFSGMEIAFVSANRIHIEIEKKQEGILAGVLGKLTASPSKFIATMLIGNNIAIVPQLDPVAKETKAARIKIINGNHIGLKDVGISDIKKSAVLISDVTDARDHASIKITTGFSILLNPPKIVSEDSRKLSRFINKEIKTAVIIPAVDPQSNDL